MVPRRPEEALPRSLGNIVNAILVDLLTMEMNGMQLVDVQMAGARLAALETLRQALFSPSFGVCMRVLQRMQQQPP